MSRSIIIGRSRSCDMTVDHPTVSGTHARLQWQGERILVEDLGSANGTFVEGKRISKLAVRPGTDVRLGDADLSWSDPALRPFLRAGATGTVVAVAIPGRRFICGKCNTRGVMPPGFSGGVLRCGACGERLVSTPPTRRRGSGLFAFLLLVGLVGVGGWWLWAYKGEAIREMVDGAVGEVAIPELPSIPMLPQGNSPQENAIRAHSLEAIVEAIDSSEATTRNTAARIASGNEGPFSIEQVARIWSRVRGEWSYVNDPRGAEYFAKASETIANDYVGDCDDFAIVLAAMIQAIGGEVRIVMMNGPEGGHAYTEVCVALEPDDARRRLQRHYQRYRDRNLGRQRVREMNFRPGEQCPIWLNLDWNAGVPGGDYEQESWAVAVYPDGRTATLAPAGTPSPTEEEPRN